MSRRNLCLLALLAVLGLLVAAGCAPAPAAPQPPPAKQVTVRYTLKVSEACSLPDGNSYGPTIVYSDRPQTAMVNAFGVTVITVPPYFRYVRMEKGQDVYLRHVEVEIMPARADCTIATSQEMTAFSVLKETETETLLIKVSQ